MTKPIVHSALVMGASSGIGEAFCRLLVTKGISELIITGRNQDRLQALATELGNGVHVVVIAADLSAAEGRQKLIEAIRARVPDLVVNNAGYGLYGDALAHSKELQMDIIRVNASTCFELTWEAARALIDAGRKGTILNVSSAAGCLDYFPGFTVYSAAKSFVNSMSQGLNVELAQHGISVLVACPGMVNTNFRNRASLGVDRTGTGVMSADFAAQQLWQQIQRRTPLRIFSWSYRFGIFLLRFSWLKKLVFRILYDRIKKRLY